MYVMDKQKPKRKASGGKHLTKRVNVGVPEQWHAVMRKLAAQKRQPVLWYLIELASREAEALGIACPIPPWEEQQGDG